MRRLWIALAVVVVASFALLLGVGLRGVAQAPPIPARVVVRDPGAAPGAPGEQVLFDGEAIRRGQNVWLSLGGQEVGSIFGHGAYVAPDWTADWLHRESRSVLDDWSNAIGGQPYDALPIEVRAAVRAHLEQVYRTNRFDPATGDLVIDPARAVAFVTCRD